MEPETLFIESDDDRIQGWYITPDPELDASELTWNDRGNGPEVVNSEVFGPYESEEAAINAMQ